MSIEKIYAAINSDPAVHKVMANAPLKIIERMRVVEFEIGEFNLRQGESASHTMKRICWSRVESRYIWIRQTASQ